MTKATHENEFKASESSGHLGGSLVDSNHGAKNGFSMGISFYHSTEYGEPGIHEDQEGFYVLEGHGTAKVGNEEYRVEPGSSFIALDGVPHTIKRDHDCQHVKVLWSHGAI